MWDSVIALGFVVCYIVSISSLTIILMGKRELAALLLLSYWCIVIVVWLFHAVPHDCLQFVIVVFPDHSQSLFSDVRTYKYLGILQLIMITYKI